MPAVSMVACRTQRPSLVWCAPLSSPSSRSVAAFFFFFVLPNGGSAMRVPPLFPYIAAPPSAGSPDPYTHNIDIRRTHRTHTHDAADRSDQQEISRNTWGMRQSSLVSVGAGTALCSNSSDLFEQSDVHNTGHGKISISLLSVHILSHAHLCERWSTCRCKAVQQ